MGQLRGWAVQTSFEGNPQRPRRLLGIFGALLSEVILLPTRQSAFGASVRLTSARPRHRFFAAFLRQWDHRPEQPGRGWPELRPVHRQWCPWFGTPRPRPRELGVSSRSRGHAIAQGICACLRSLSGCPGPSSRCQATRRSFLPDGTFNEPMKAVCELRHFLADPLLDPARRRTKRAVMSLCVALRWQQVLEKQGTFVEILLLKVSRCVTDWIRLFVISRSRVRLPATRTS